MSANVTVINYEIYHLSQYDACFQLNNLCSGVNMAALVLQLSLQAASEYSMYACG
jgi:hypothetical protein